MSLDLRLLWVVTLDPSVGEHHGAGMRFLNFARELSAQGAQVYFATNVWKVGDRAPLEKFLRQLEASGVIAGWMLTEYKYTVWQGRMGALAFYPGLTEWILRNIRKQPAQALLDFMREHGIQAAIVSDRMMLFLGKASLRAVPTIFDWTDSMALYYWRALVAKVRNRKWSGLLGFLRDYQTNILAEAYYGRLATLNTVVSPVDKAWLDRTNFKARRNRVWMNGTNTESGAVVEKVPNRIIFSGAMDYPPNYEGALWFIQQVFPLILARHPEAQFVVAGVNPAAELKAKASERIHITGFVANLGAEIAKSSLYVAPLLSGGGFRNKVIEAIMKRTFLVGTTISVEFLPADFRSLLLIADTAHGMAEAVGNYFDDPAQYRERLNRLHEIVVAEYSWRGRSGDLLQLLKAAATIYAGHNSD